MNTLNSNVISKIRNSLGNDFKLSSENDIINSLMPKSFDENPRLGNKRQYKKGYVKYDK